MSSTWIIERLQRIKKSGGAIASALYFMYDEAGHLVGEYDSSGNLIQETVWLGDIPVATLRPNGGNVDVFYVHTDQLNTPRKVSRPSDNALRWRWDPTPFGEGVPDQNPAAIGTFVYNLRFPGQQFDTETNLNYNYFRDYDAAIGRYVQSDPIGLEGGLNTFGYALGNPVMHSDPTGELVGVLANPVGVGVAAGLGLCMLIPSCAQGIVDSVNTIREMCSSKDDADVEDDNCEALYQSTLKTCASLTGRKKFKCFEAARENREQCYQQGKIDKGLKQ